MRGSLLLFLFRSQSGCFIVTKLKWENNSVASYGVARIFPEVRIVFKIPLYWLPHPFQIWTLLLYSIFFIIGLTTLRCIHKACIYIRLGDVRGGGILAWQFFKIWVRSNVIRRIQEPTLNCFFLTVSNHFRVWWASECDEAFRSGNRTAGRTFYSFRLL